MSKLSRRDRGSSGRRTAVALAAAALVALALGVVAAVAGVTPGAVVRTLTVSHASSAGAHVRTRTARPAAHNHTAPLALFTGSVGTAAGFEDDDGNLSHEALTDWNDFGTPTWTGSAPYQQGAATANGWTLVGLTDATNTTSDSAFKGGVKQNDSCPVLDPSKAPNKDDLARVYLATKTGSNGHVYLMLAWERIPLNTTSSDTHVAFEFHQGNAACANGDGLVQRTEGDLLLFYDFQSGNASISASTWDATNGVWRAPVALAADAQVNSGTVTDTIAPDQPVSLDDLEFGEAGVDLTQSFSNLSQGGKECETFGNVYALSRSSGDGDQAQMEDLVGPAGIHVSNCASPTIATTLSATSALVGATVHDSSTLSGASSSAGGTVTYSVYGDSQCTQGKQDAGTKTVTNGVVPDSNGIQFNAAGTYYWQASYSGDDNNNAAVSPCTDEILTIAKNSPSIATTLSATAGAVGDSVHDSSTLAGATADAGGTVAYSVFTDDQCSQGRRDAGTKTVTNGVVPDSDALPFDAAGTYYWQAVYSGDAKNDAATSPCTDEILTIAKNTPSIATTLSATSAAVGDTVHDSSTLSGVTATAGGTVTYSVFTDDQCSRGKRDAGTKTVTNGVVPDSDGLLFGAAGTYYWQASYSGDANNDAAVSPCTDEILTIAKNSPSIATTLSATAGAVGDTVHDSSTLSDASPNAGGTVTYSVFTDDRCSQGKRDAGTKTVTNGVVPDSDALQFGAAGTYYWQASYSGDGNNDAAVSPCTDEILNIGKNTPSISTTLSATEVLVGASVHDSATLAGSTATAGGTVAYSVYSDSGCSKDERDAGTKTVTNGVVPDSDALSFPDAGTFYWQAVYSGDANNAGATSACTEEQLLVDHPAISITKNPKSQLLEPGADASFTIAVTNTGSVTLTDVAVTDALAPGCAKTIGTLTPGQSTSYDCSLANVTAPFTNTATATGHPPVGPDVTATDTADVSVKATPTITTTLSATEILAGSSVNDSARLTGATADAGGTVTYTVFSDSACTTRFADAGKVDVDAGSVPNSNGVAFQNAGTYYWQAVYSGDTKNDGATSACTEEQLLVDSPAISITKNPKSQSITTGGTATFTITVKNTGSVTLTNVTVVDLLAPACAKTIGTLTPGQSTSYDCALSGVAASFTNSATAAGHPPVGPDVTATDTAPVTVNAVPPPPPPPPPAPRIDLAIAKVGTPNPTTLGGNITWTLTVTNNGPDAASGVTVADPTPPGTTFVSASSTQGTCTGGAVLNCRIGSMNAGATVTVTLVTGTTTTGTIPNTATVVGNEAETNTANNTASASVTVKGPFKPPVVNYCTALRVSPKQLLVGRAHVLTMKVSKHGRAVKGVKVRIKGSTLRIVTKPSNRKGVVRRTVKPMRPGIVTFRPVASKRCNAPRIGVIGVFTPPVTG